MGNYWIFVTFWSAWLLSANGLPDKTFKSSTIGCYTCATENLRENWYLTGYPFPVTPESYTDDCMDSKLVTNLDAIPCNNTCVTYKFSIPIGDGIKYTNAYVRGCLSALTGIPAARISDDYCEHEQHITSKAYHRQARFCRTDKCNSEEADDVELGGSDYGRDCTGGESAGAVAAMNCYSCEDALSCSSTVTAEKGSWCFKLERKNGTTRSYERAVTKVNQLGGTGCKVFNSPALSNPHVKEAMCFCDSNLCNNAQRNGGTWGLIAGVLLAIGAIFSSL